MESKQYRIKIAFIEPLTEKKWEIKRKVKMEITENDIINTLCHKHLNEITPEDIKTYRCEILGDCND